MLSRRFGLLALLVAPCSGLLCVLFYWQSLSSVTHHLHEQLQSSLPDKVVAAGVNRSEPLGLSHYLREKIDADLKHLKPANAFSPFKQCRADLLQLRGRPFETTTNPERYLQLEWSLQGQQESLALGLSCQKNWIILLGLPLSLSFLAVLLASQFHPPLSSLQQRCLQRLKQQGNGGRQGLQNAKYINRLSPLQQDMLEEVLNFPQLNVTDSIAAIAASHIPDPTALLWFPPALKACHDDIGAALQCCCAPEKLVFQLDSGRILIRNIPIKLPSTPFFYYLWYAQRRIRNENEGWFINPPSSRPDRQHDQDMIALMQEHGGHHKAINDLSDKGLRAKTLDQNRSKIKDEIVSVLGEGLAKPFLFDMERDATTARFKYRLALNPENILIQ